MITQKQAELALSYLPPVYPGEDTIEDVIKRQGMRLVRDFGDSLVLVESRHGEQWVLGGVGRRDYALVGDRRREYVVAVLLMEGWEKFLDEVRGVV